MGQRKEIGGLPPATGYYRFLSAVQFGLGFLLLFFATYVAMEVHGERNGVFPYYAGSFMTSSGIIIVSFVGVAIYDAGQHEWGSNVAARVHSLVLAHLLLSLVVAALGICGFVLTTLYGLCPSGRCSYTTKETFNYGMAAFLMGMQLLCLAASFFSIKLFRLYQKQRHPRSRDRTLSSRADFQEDT